ncbi:MAG: Bug family tripartite tricarboxylate transporter substrate binding protein [Pseudorhodoplanes sp.]|uniref:Bug family tripartite tricarboxylate transporter substrate binding protein n=1 Tax=Pseudorhodoplanes sp. TaxID=1934341 RepID=UPI003D0FABA6
MLRTLRSWVVCISALLLLWPRGAVAQDYPSKPITFVVAFAAGGVADGIGRMIAQKLGEVLRQTIIVENRGGAGGNLAARQVAAAAPDGYTILVTTTALAINETLHRSKGFAADDLTTVAIVASSPEAFAVNKANSASSLAEFLASAKGKTINFGSAGVGSGSHIAGEYFFKEIARVPATHVPFQGGAPAINAAIGNHIDLLSITLGGGLVAQVRSGALKGLGVMHDSRVGTMKDVPTFDEAGFPGFHAASWVGLFVPAKTPADIVAKLNGAVDAIVRQPDFQQRLAALGFDPVTGNQAAAAKRFKDDVAEWGKRVNALGMKIE